MKIFNDLLKYLDIRNVLRVLKFFHLTKIEPACDTRTEEIIMYAGDQMHQLLLTLA